MRQGTGKVATKAVRREGLIPCELYGGEENVHFTTTFNAVKDIIYTPDFYVASLNLNGKEHKAIVKDIQFHPVTDDILHIDFQELVPGRMVQTEIPVRTIGVAEGVKTGGKLMMKVRKLKVKTTPEALVDKVEIDVSHLLLGQSVKVRDIADTGMQIMNSPSIPIASVEVPRALRSASAKGEGEEGEGTEGEEGEEGGEGAESAEGGEE